MFDFREFKKVRYVKYYSNGIKGIGLLHNLDVEFYLEGDDLKLDIDDGKEVHHATINLDKQYDITKLGRADGNKLVVVCMDIEEINKVIVTMDITINDKLKIVVNKEEIKG